MIIRGVCPCMRRAMIGPGFFDHVLRHSFQPLNILLLTFPYPCPSFPSTPLPLALTVSSSSDLQVSLMRRAVSRSWPFTPTRCEASTCSLPTSTSRNWQQRLRTTAVLSWRDWSGLLSPPPWTDTSRSLGTFKYAKVALGMGCWWFKHSLLSSQRGKCAGEWVVQVVADIQSAGVKKWRDKSRVKQIFHKRITRLVVALAVVSSPLGRWNNMAASGRKSQRDTKKRQEGVQLPHDCSEYNRYKMW